MSIRRTKAGTFEVRWREPSGRLRQATFARESIAPRFLKSVQVDIDRGSYIDPRGGRVRFEEVAREWQRTRVNLEPSTKAQHATALEAHLLPRFGPRRIGSITDFDVRSFIAELLEAGLAPATVTKYFQVLSQIMRSAVRNRMIGWNPCEGVEGPGEEPLGETIFLTPEELNALSDAFEPRFRPMVLLAGWRGLKK